MRRNEMELIAALAEGRLEDESEARALIASSPHLRDEYEAQRAAIESVRELAPASLSATERSALRRDIWTELRNTAERRSPARRLVGWPAYVTALVLVVGALAVLRTPLDQADMAAAPTFEEVAQGLSDTTVADDGAAQPGTESAAQETQRDSLAADDLQAYEELADAVRSGDTQAFTRIAELPYGGRAAASACLDLAGLESHIPLGRFEVHEGIEVVVASSVENPSADTPISFVD
ncbi:MAG: hypothetical protein R3258_10335, partial [Acidimicrobiia bacterium]|nr:hypothetical protein [Acidimicrobiia bacterium]